MITRRIVASALAVALAVFALTGCNIFAPPGGGGGGDIDVQYKVRTSPEFVIYNLYSAYEDMDADEYLDCLAEEFEFHLAESDITADPTLPEYWGKNTEEAIHRLMFRDGNTTPPPPELVVDRISLDLTVVSDEWDQGADPVDPMDDIWTYRLSTDLMVYFPDNLQRHANADVEFLFRIDRDQTGPDGETLYEIIRWNDLADRGTRTQPFDPFVEDTSFGMVKADFR